MADFVPIL